MCVRVRAQIKGFENAPAFGKWRVRKQAYSRVRVRVHQANPSHILTVAHCEHVGGI